MNSLYAMARVKKADASNVLAPSTLRCRATPPPPLPRMARRRAGAWSWWRSNSRAAPIASIVAICGVGCRGGVR